MSVPYQNPYLPYPQYAPTYTPAQYPQMQYPQMQQNVAQNPQYPQGGIQTKLDIVQGKAAADVYQVDAGHEVFLFDLDNPVVYKKRRGFDNKLEEETFDLVKRQTAVNTATNIDLGAYVRRDELLQFVTETAKAEVDRRLSEFPNVNVATRPIAKKGNQKTEE